MAITTINRARVANAHLLTSKIKYLIFKLYRMAYGNKGSNPLKLAEISPLGLL
jgi:hypothetical protein